MSSFDNANDLPDEIWESDCPDYIDDISELSWGDEGCWND